jgi:hypothetical protein
MPSLQILDRQPSLVQTMQLPQSAFDRHRSSPLEDEQPAAKISAVESKAAWNAVLVVIIIHLRHRRSDIGDGAFSS